MPSEKFETIREVLNNAVDGKIDDYIISIEEGKLKGENFLGDIAFVSLKNKQTNEVIDLVVKQALEQMSEMQYFNTVYAKEIQFYEEIWPILNKFQQDHSIGFDKIPKCYTTCKNVGNEKIILEDLRSQHFRIYEKTNPVDRKHYELIFKSYGTYHGISCAFREQHPEQFARIAESLKTSRPEDKDSEQPKNFGKMIARSVQYVRDLFDPELDEGIYKKLDEISADLASSMVTEYKGDAPIILHGDCWSNNLMFKYDSNGNVEDMRFLDFQMVQTGTPVNDLSYCLYSGASKEILDNLNDLLEIYIKSFSETLEKFNCKPEKPYTLDALKSEWKQYGKFGFLTGLIIWRLKLVDKNNIPNISDDSFINLHKIADEHLEQFNTRLKDLAMHFYENNYF